MMRHTINILLALLAVMMLAPSCSTKKETAKSTTVKAPERKVETNEGFRTLSMDKATFTLLNTNGSQQSLNGSIRICRDSIIICSITPFVGVNMEFARIGITKQGITIMDRINKHYYAITYAEAKDQFGMEMNYNAFESIFTNRVFIYNSPYIPLMSDFKLSSVGELHMLTRSDDKVSQEFYYDNNQPHNRLVGGMLAAGNTYSMRWNYNEFEMVNSVNFPKILSLKMAGPDFHRQIKVQYKAVELDRDRSFKFEVPSSYTRVTLDELLNF